MRVRRSTLVDAPVAVILRLLARDRKEDNLGAEPGLRARIGVDAGVEQADAGPPVARCRTGRAVHEQAGEEADEMVLLRHGVPAPTTSVPLMKLAHICCRA